MQAFTVRSLGSDWHVRARDWTSWATALCDVCAPLPTWTYEGLGVNCLSFTMRSLGADWHVRERDWTSWATALRQREFLALLPTRSYAGLGLQNMYRIYIAVGNLHLCRVCACSYTCLFCR